MLRGQRYLGDGVYVGFEDGRMLVKLWTSNGVATTDEVWLEPEVLGGLLRWVDEQRDHAKHAQRSPE